MTLMEYLVILLMVLEENMYLFVNAQYFFFHSIKFTHYY